MPFIINLQPAHFTRTLTRAHAHRLAIVYATLAEHAARDCRERVVSGLSPDESIDDAVSALRDQSNTILIAQALVSLVENDPWCAVTTDNVDIDKVVCDYRDGTLRIGEYRSAQFSRLMAATEQPLPLRQLLELAAPNHRP